MIVRTLLLWIFVMGSNILFAQPPCLVDYEFSIFPEPDGGSSCTSGENYSFCLTINSWDGDSPDEFHGFTIDLGPGWVLGVDPVSMPPSCDGLGEWGYYDAVTSTGTGMTVGEGFFYDSDNDGDPGNSAGDPCVGPWEFCWNLNVIPCLLGDNDGLDATVTINTYSDGETGAFDSPTCVDDELIIFGGVVACAPSGCIEPPQAFISGGGTFCPDDLFAEVNFELTGNPPFVVEYTINGALTSFTTSDFFYTISGAGPGEYCLVSVSDIACPFSFASGCVIVDYLPNATISMTEDGTFCPGDSYDILVSVDPPQSFTFEYSYLGMPQGSITSDNYEYTLTVDQPGFYQITSLTDVDCPDPFPFFGGVNVDFIQPTTIIFGGVAFLGCGGSNTTLTGEAYGTPPIDITIALDGVDIETITLTDQGEFDYQAFSPGTYTVSAVSSSDCPGQIMGEYIVEENSSLIETATLSGGGTICPGEMVDVIFTLSADESWGFTYTIDGVEQEIITTFDNPYILSTDIPGVYEFTQVSAGCPANFQGTAEVILNGGQTLSFTDDLVICEGESGSLELNYSGTGEYEFSYSIDGVDQGSIVTSDNPYYILAIGEGNYEITELLDAGNCGGGILDAATVTISPFPTAALSGDIGLCDGASSFLPIQITGVAPWTISYEIDGVAQTDIIIGSDTDEFPVSIAGTYTLTGISNEFCQGSVSGTGTVTQAVTPEASISGGMAICQGASLDLTIALTGIAPFDFDLTLDGVIVSSYTSDELNYVISVTDEGTYAVSSITDAYCAGAGANTTDVSFFALPTIEVTPDFTICEGSEVSLVGAAIGGQGGPFAYSWVIGTDTIVGEQISVVVSETAEYTFLVEDECGIPYPAFTQVTTVAPPIIDVTGPSFAICEALDVTVVTSIPLGGIGTDCYWTVNGEIYPGCQNLELPLSAEGDYDIGLHVETADGCVVDSVYEALISVNPAPIADFTFTPEVPTIITDALDMIDHSTGADQYYWTLENFPVSNEAAPTIDLPRTDSPESYKICQEVTNEFGCVDSLCQAVFVEGEMLVYVPNAFSPDTDGVNDFWRPVVTGAMPSDYRLKVFDRLGQLVWETDDIEEQWIGQGAVDQKYYAGDDLYQWQLEVRRIGSVDKRTYQGFVTLVR